MYPVLVFKTVYLPKLTELIGRYNYKLIVTNKKTWKKMNFKSPMLAEIICYSVTLIHHLENGTTVSTQILRHSWLERHMTISWQKVHFLGQIIDYKGQIMSKFELNGTKKLFMEIRTAPFYLRRYGIPRNYEILYQLNVQLATTTINST